MNPSIRKKSAYALFFIFILCFFPNIHARAEETIEKDIASFNVPFIEAFIFKWQKSGGSELGSSQLFITDLCKLLDLPIPDAPRPDIQDNTYIFEHAVTRTSSTGRASTGRIDFYRKGHFIWESKQGSDKATAENDGPRRKGTFIRGTTAESHAMLNARIQAEDYARALPHGEQCPPFVVVADIPNMEIYADFHGTGEYLPFPSARDHRITLEDLRKPEVQERIRKIFSDPLSLDPSRESEKVTREIALRLSFLAKSLEESGYDADTSYLFVTRCVFLMYLEDCGFLPYESFAKLLQSAEQAPETFAPTLTALWRAMYQGGDSPIGPVPRFQGAIFEDAQALPLTAEQIAMLQEAAKANWSGVETSIFGTLLRQALTPQEKRKLGAHYTPRAYVERIVTPTVMEPERKLWEQAKEAALERITAGEQQAAISIVTDFYRHLMEIIVLDPSCGCGNFLTVTMELLKELEGEVVQALRTLGLSERDIRRLGHGIGPHQFKGIEVVQRAADISEIVLWISYLQQYMKIYGKLIPPESILQDTATIECRDAVLGYDEQGRPQPADPWPEATYIVGNPPFVGNHRMREYLGERYTEDLRDAYPEVPRGTEYVLYWWHRAASLVRTGKVKRFGLITTKSIRQVKGRKILEYHMTADPPLTLVFAVPDHPWADASDAAQVHIAMTAGAITDELGTLLTQIQQKPDGKHQSEQQYVVYFERKKGKINPNLTIGADVSKAKALRANRGISSNGVTPNGKSFIVSPSQAKSLGLGTTPGLEKHIRPYRNGRDIAGIPRNVMAIDLYGLTNEEVKRRYPAVYQWLLDKVKPIRDKNPRKEYREKWWIFGTPGSGMRQALGGIKRYIATPKTARRRYFVFLDTLIIPDSALIAVASDDAYILGVLSSKYHNEWILATGGRLGVGNDPVYVKSLALDAFPFPNANEEQKARIRKIAEALESHRKRRQEMYPQLTLTHMYNVMEQLVYRAKLTPKEQTISEQGDVPTLLALHRELDTAVADAYGWPVDLPTEDILERLLSLNKKRRAEEATGVIRWLRPEYQNP